MSIQPDEDELQVRDRLRDLGVSYAPEPGEGVHLEHAAPAAEDSGHQPLQSLRVWAESDEEAAVPAPRAGSPRLPDWWAPDRPDVTAEEDPEDPAPAEDDQEEPGGFRARLRKHLEGVPTVADALAAEKEAKAAEAAKEAAEAAEAGDTEDDEDTGEDDAEDTEGDGPEEGGPIRKTAARLLRVSRPGKAPRPRRRPRFAAPGVPHTMKPEKERRSLVEVIRSTPDHVVWMLYSGSALGAGFYLGWPQWVADGVDYLAAEHPSFTDAYSITCYALAAGVFALDYRARSWIFPVAWFCRIPTASLVVGIPLSGDPTPISQMF